MNFPNDLKYTKDHEWVRVEGSVATIGITEFAQHELGEIVFAETPAPGRSFSKGDSLCVVESTKAASDVYAPIGGKVKEGNAALQGNPQLINSDPYGEGWMVKLEGFSTGDVGALMTADQYRTHVGEKA
ncbi:MAG: glycine cleavage system protein GcvH [Pseudomonadota bacterium]|jgi:glycine cleavage system H protein